MPEIMDVSVLATLDVLVALIPCHSRMTSNMLYRSVSEQLDWSLSLLRHSLDHDSTVLGRAEYLQ